MKRILLVLMSVFMLAFLVGCGNDASKQAESANQVHLKRLLYKLQRVLKVLLPNWQMHTKKAIT